MPCAMSSLRGASGVVGCDRVVCPLVLHATTIAHLDVLLCTLLFFLLCAVLLCGAVPLSCGLPCALPALPVVWLRGAVAVVCGCGASCPCSPCPCGCMLRCALYSLYFSCLFSGDNTCPIYGMLYVGLVRSLYTCPIFRLAIYDPFCTYNKKPAHGFRIWISKSRLEFSMFCFFFLRNFPR